MNEGFLKEVDALPPNEAEKLLLEAEANLYRSSLYLTNRFLLDYRDINPRTHKRMIDGLEAPTNRKITVMPRGSLKTSLGVVGFAIWLLIRNFNIRILLDSELYSNSKNVLREIRLHLENPKLTRIFGTFETGHCWNEGEIIVKQRDKIFKEASITCSGIGAQKTGQHYDVILADDMNSPANSHTPEGRQKVIDHYRLYTSLLDPNGIISVTGTRYSADDLIGFILKNEVFIQDDEGLLS